ncbi:hypothetical protein AAHH67_21395 [Niallia circulans]
MEMMNLSLPVANKFVTDYLEQKNSAEDFFIILILIMVAMRRELKN